MKKYISIIKVEPFIYKLDKYSDDTMFTLYMCLTDGLGAESYLNFLEDSERMRFSGNICSMLKTGSMVSLFIDEDIIPGLPVFISSTENLIKMYKQIEKLKSLDVNTINITMNQNELIISGE